MLPPLQQHMQTHTAMQTDSQTKPAAADHQGAAGSSRLACNTCNYTCKNETNMRKHLEKHQSNSLLICSFMVNGASCGKTY